jgi:signal transduction histidine kinase
VRGAEVLFIGESLAIRQRVESLGRLTSGIAHDFNNLLEVILNYAALAGDELDDRPAVRADVREIERAAQRGAELTRRLLLFSRPENERAEVLNLNEVIRALESLLQRILREDIELDIRLDPHLWNLRGDAGQLERVLVNLAVNARDAMPAGGRLLIGTDNLSALEADARRSPGQVQLTVTDTGVGMGEEVAGRAREPFFTTKPEGQGTGLGLATVYEIVEQCDGEIEMATAPGMGTSFILHFPATEDPPPLRVSRLRPAKASKRKGLKSLEGAGR